MEYDYISFYFNRFNLNFKFKNTLDYRAVEKRSLLGVIFANLVEGHYLFH